MIGGDHTCTGSCICTKRETGPGRDTAVVNPECPVKELGVNSVALSSDGKRAVSCGNPRSWVEHGGLVKMWNVETGALVSTPSHRVM